MTLRRTGLARHKGLERGGPLRPVSDKKLKAAGGWLASTFLPKRPTPAVPPARRKTLADRSGSWCEPQLAEAGCWGRATDPHHRITRKDGGRHGEAKERSDQLSGLVHACRPCHRWVHDHPAKARDLGLLLREHQIPAYEPVLYRGDLVYLDDAGNKHSFEEVGV
jgi:hypothetical protein